MTTVASFTATTTITSSSLQSESQCIPCDPGRVCSGSGLTAPNGLCAAGYYCRGSAYTDKPRDGGATGDFCPKGHYCPEGTGEPNTCIPGSFNNVTGLDYCFDCPAGFYCVDGEIPLACPRGRYCPGNTTAAQPYCPRGTYNPDFGMVYESDCRPCLGGYYCDTLGATEFDASLNNTGVGKCSPSYYCKSGVNISTPTSDTTSGLGGPCPVGHYCPEQTEDPDMCPMGTYRDVELGADVSDCFPCILGHYCGSMGLANATGPCDPGFYCLYGSSDATPTGADASKGGPCLVGHYCPQGTSYPLACPAGTYNNVTGVDACFECPASYYCPENITDYTGYPCPEGHYCPNGTTGALEFPCPKGSYRNLTRGVSQEDCFACPPGFYCGGEGLSLPTDECDQGYFCVVGAWSAQPSEYDNFTVGDCLCPSNVTGGQCQPGYYCPQGSHEPVACTEGNYCATPGLYTVTSQCKAGYYCDRGASIEDPTDGITGNICPPGRYCGLGTGVDQPRCPLGTFSNQTGNQVVSDCTNCTQGYYCGSLGLTEPTDKCAEGYFCPTGQEISSPFPCAQGYYCPAGSHEMIHCPSGTYQDETAQGTCKTCPSGTVK
ncbi:fibrillin-1-like [Elysia marginata]|uniref:Fibrillin-1-like n=1 Tax=Elysia marginata TaxID=1093978 RepID=A0AAV4JN20_9GAST|nr:fibrillin-1-like [Elysia marginata]